MKEVSKEMPVGTFSDVSGRPIDPETFKPTNYPQLTEPNYKNYKDTIKYLAGSHVNGVNRELLKTATDGLTPEQLESIADKTYGVIPGKDIDVIPDNELPPKFDLSDKMNGATYVQPIPKLSPMNKPESFISLNHRDPDYKNATLMHELKHARDDKSASIKIPKFELDPSVIKENEVMKGKEHVPDKNLDQVIKALSNNDLTSLYNNYTGDHFDDLSTLPEDAQKITKFANLQPRLKSKP